MCAQLHCFCWPRIVHTRVFVPLGTFVPFISDAKQHKRDSGRTLLDSEPGKRKAQGAKNASGSAAAAQQDGAAAEADMQKDGSRNRPRWTLLR